MKRTAFTFVVMLVVICGHAQIQKGAVLLEGSLSYSSTTAEQENWANINDYRKTVRTYFSFRPGIGVMVSKRVMAGMKLGYDHTRLEDEYDNYYSDGKIKVSTNIYNAGPYIKTFLPLNEQLYLTLTGSASLGFGLETEVNDDYGNDELESEVKRLRIEVSPGLSYFVSGRWALTASFGQLYFETMKQTYDRSSQSSFDRVFKTSDSGASLSFNTFSLGVQYFLRNGE
jgi:long-subunit fatty acid transport protein